MCECFGHALRRVLLAVPVLLGVPKALGAEHVRIARAKTLSEPAVVIRHALSPVVTLVGLHIGYLLGGALVTETMFN